jgi:hypothetical protein
MPARQVPASGSRPWPQELTADRRLREDRAGNHLRIHGSGCLSSADRHKPVTLPINLRPQARNYIAEVGLLQ